MAAFGQFLRGVNISGAEFGDQSLPGTIGSTHTYNSARTFEYFAARSLSLIRLQLRWERLQPVLGGPLDPVNLNALKQDVAWAKAAGCKLSIEPHNFGRYRIHKNNGNPNWDEYIIDNVYGGNVKVAASDLADFWVKLSNEFKDEPGVYAYDLMNEPHDMGSASWKNISQVVVSAIRANGDGKLIMVPGDSWSNAQLWPNVHGATSWITDPMNNFTYQAHLYFDSDYSGSYAKTYDQELAANPNLATVGATRVAPFITWCQNNNVRCYLGEFGVPNNDDRWLTVLENFMQALDAAGVDGTYWAAGEWWGNYSLSVQPLNDFTTDRVQTRVLEAHLSPGAFTSLSSAASWGYATGPGSLVAGYGKSLAPGTEQAATVPLPVQLQGTQVQLTDSNGQTTPAPLIFVSAGQVNYLVPAEVPVGRVDVKVVNNGTTLGIGVLQVESIAPTIFTANNNGSGIAAAQIQRFRTDGSQSLENVAVFDNAQNKFIPAPIDFGANGDRLFLILYGTGFRNATTVGSTLKIANLNIPLSYAGPQNQFPGLDQVNAELPHSLAGQGEVTVQFAASGKAANPVTIAFH